MTYNYPVNISKIGCSAFAHSRSSFLARVNEASNSIFLTLVEHITVIAPATSELSVRIKGTLL